MQDFKNEYERYVPYPDEPAFQEHRHLPLEIELAFRSRKSLKKDVWNNAVRIGLLPNEHTITFNAAPHRLHNAKLHLSM